MTPILHLLTKSATRRILALAISALVSALLGWTLDAATVATAIQVIITIVLVATGDQKTAEDLLDGLADDTTLGRIK